MAIHDIGKLGPKRGTPTWVEWRWYFGLPSIPLWVVLGLLLILPPHNHRWQAWLILIVPLPVAVLGWLLSLLTGPSSNLEISVGFFTSIGIAWASVWLLAPWIRAKNRSWRALLCWVVMCVLGAVGYLGCYGFSFSGDTTGMWAVFWMVATVPLVAGMTLSGYSCRQTGELPAFMLWLALWMPVVSLAGVFLFTIVMAVIREEPTFILAGFGAGMVIAAFVSVCLYALNLPAMLLARCSPLYGERFHSLFCPEERLDLSELRAQLAGSVAPAAISPGDETEGECPFARPEA
ncbi:MAG: hypothetical protein JW888_02085 [Pirellulales bacterium]|nr:hypothetical protein [Pirellulales bacterium]